MPFNGKSKALGNNREVVATFQNLQEHLKAVGVRLRETTFQLGRLLRFDPKRGRFIGDGARDANPLLTRNYRKPFDIPARV